MHTYREKTMEWNFLFFLNAAMLGVGLAMDAFSVSMANGMNEPEMRPERMCLVAGFFGGFQALMPLVGWFCVHTVVQHFRAFEQLIPWIALILLGWIGGNMIFESICSKDTIEKQTTLGLGVLAVQGVATSIDALSVGFTIAEYGFWMALTAALIIAAVTFAICMAGLEIGKRFGTRLSNRAQIWGGLILIAIGLEIFLRNL